MKTYQSATASTVSYARPLLSTIAFSSYSLTAIARSMACNAPFRSELSRTSASPHRLVSLIILCIFLHLNRLPRLVSFSIHHCLLLPLHRSRHLASRLLHEVDCQHLELVSHMLPCLLRRFSSLPHLTLSHVSLKRIRRLRDERRTETAVLLPLYFNVFILQTRSLILNIPCRPIDGPRPSSITTTTTYEVSITGHASYLTHCAAHSYTLHSKKPLVAETVEEKRRPLSICPAGHVRLARCFGADPVWSCYPKPLSIVSLDLGRDVAPILPQR